MTTDLHLPDGRTIAIDPDAGRLTSHAANLAAGWGGALIAVVVVAGLAGLIPALPRTPTPVYRPAFGPSDGLPATLVANRRYMLTFTIDYPKGWERKNPVGNHYSGLNVYVRLGASPVDYFLCAQAFASLPGQSVTETCPLIPWRAGSLTVDAGAGPAGLTTASSDSPTDAVATVDYHHIVTAAP